MIKSSWYPPKQIKLLARGVGNQISLDDFVSDFFNRYKGDDPFYKLMQFHLKVQLPDDFLVKVDRMSMAYSLETRVPFLDYRLVEFMINVSKHLKMEGFQRKSVLRNTIGRKLPKSLMKASKKGFTPPVREWFKNPSFDDRLKSLYTNDFFDAEMVKRIVEENKQGKADWGNFIWILTVFNAWNTSKG
jgi:asparagine synthase (glutamine-hydrolysing)